MKIRQSIVLLTLVLVGIISTACGGSSGPVSITSAETSKGYTDNKAVDATSTFSPSDAPLHCVVQLANVADGTKVKAVWTAVDVKDASGQQVTDEKLIEKETVLSGSGDTGHADFTLTHEKDLPVGKYKVEVYLNDKLDKTVPFEIK